MFVMEEKYSKPDSQNKTYPPFSWNAVVFPYIKKTLSKKVCQNAGLKFLNWHLPSFPICFPSKVKATLLFKPSSTSDIIFLFYSVLPTVFPTVQHSHIALICSKILELNSESPLPGRASAKHYLFFIIKMCFFSNNGPTTKPTRNNCFSKIIHDI